MGEIVKGMLNSPICPLITPYLHLHSSNTTLSLTTQSTPPTIPYLQLPLIYNSLSSSSLFNFNWTHPYLSPTFSFILKDISFFLFFFAFFGGEGGLSFHHFLPFIFFHFLFLYNLHEPPPPTHTFSHWF